MTVRTLTRTRRQPNPPVCERRFQPLRPQALSLPCAAHIMSCSLAIPANAGMAEQTGREHGYKPGATRKRLPDFVMPHSSARAGSCPPASPIPSSAEIRTPVSASSCSLSAAASSVTSSARYRAREISSRVEDWRANVRVRWWFRRFRYGPQSGSLGHVSSPRSSNRACGFPAHGSRTRSCLRPRKAARSRSKASEAHVIEQPLVREAHQFSGPHLVLAAQPLA